MSFEHVLKGVRVLVTRPEPQARSFCEKLEGLGAEVLELPLIRILPPDSWEGFDRSFENLRSFDWIIFASANAVNFTLARLYEKGLTAGFSRIKIAAVGPSTAQALVTHAARKPNFVPDSFVAESLVQGFPGYPDLSGVKILWPKTSIGRTYVKDKLEEAGAVVQIVYCYKTEGPEEPDKVADRLQELLDSRALDCITLTSTETVKQLARCLDDVLKKQEEIASEAGLRQAARHRLLGNVKIAVIGPETYDAAMRYLGRADIKAKTYTTDGLVTALTKHVVRHGAGARVS